MDIAKYIGLYLLKNHFCYIHGLGNLELKKKPASHDGQALSAPQFEVVLSATGSIDDSLANFIATHEQTSISKAANALRDFSMATRAALAEGKEVDLPALGKLKETNGIIKFITDANLQYSPPSIPILRTSKRLEEAPSFGIKAPPEDSFNRNNNINWSKLGIWGGLGLVVILLIIFGIKSMNNNSSSNTLSQVSKDTQITAQATPMPIVRDTNLVDTTVTANVTPTPPAVSASADGTTRVVVGTYTNRIAAERRVKTLTGNGNNVNLVAQDSSTFLVVMPIMMQAADSTRTLDSLRRMFNPKGVRILQ